MSPCMRLFIFLCIRRDKSPLYDKIDNTCAHNLLIPREIGRFGRFRAAPIVLPAETLSQHLLILVFRDVSIKSIPREIDRIGQFRAAPNGLPVGLQRVCSRLRSAAQRQPHDARTIGFPSLNR